MRLTAGLYNDYLSGQLFDLKEGQMRNREIVHNGGWYNKRGEKIGWGDLNIHDLIKIKDSLQEGEIFIILPESASFWDFVKHHGIIGGLCTTTGEEHSPGLDYVASKAMFAIFPGKCCRIDLGEDSYTYSGSGVELTVHNIDSPSLRKSMT